MTHATRRHARPATFHLEQQGIELAAGGLLEPASVGTARPGLLLIAGERQLARLDRLVRCGPRAEAGRCSVRAEAIEREKMARKARYGVLVLRVKYVPTGEVKVRLDRLVRYGGELRLEGFELGGGHGWLV